jgi:hypothetical protein
VAKRTLIRGAILVVRSMRGGIQGALESPRHVTPDVKAQPGAVTVIVDFVLDLGRRDRVVASGTCPSGTVAGGDLSRLHEGQPTILEVPANQQPQCGMAR